MSYQVTAKSVNQSHLHVFRVGYCDLQQFLRTENRTAYTAGIYGWNSDIYEFGPYAISTGHRPTGDSKISEKALKEYKERYKKLVDRSNNTAMSYEKIAEINHDYIYTMLQKSLKD